MTMRKNLQLPQSLPHPPHSRGEAELIIDRDHFTRIIKDGLCRAAVSLDIMTADFKAMLIPTGRGRTAHSIVEVLRNLADRGVEIRLMHAGTPSGPALRELKQGIPKNLTIRRCPRLHA